MSPTHFKRLLRVAWAALSWPHVPAPSRRLTRAKVAQGTPENPAAPAHALGVALYADAFRQALGRGRMFWLTGPNGTGPKGRSLPVPWALPPEGGQPPDTVAS